MKTLNFITSAHWQPELNTSGSIVEGIFDLKQSIQTILLTPKGSDPHRPNFGCDIYKYLDWPVNQVTPYLVREAVEALKYWEPRISLVQVMVNIEGSQVTLLVKWKAADGITQLSEVMYERTSAT